MSDAAPPATLILRRMAGARMRSERPGATSTPTELVREAHLCLLPELQSVSERTVFRQWRAARAWIVREVDAV